MSIYNKLSNFVSVRRNEIVTSVVAFGVLVVATFSLRAFVNWWIGKALDEKPESQSPSYPGTPALPPAYVFRTPEQQAEYDESIRIRTTVAAEHDEIVSIQMQVAEEMLQPGSLRVPSPEGSPLPPLIPLHDSVRVERRPVTPPSPVSSEGAELVDMPSPMQGLGASRPTQTRSLWPWFLMRG